MISYKIDDSLVYEILNFIANSPNMKTTPLEILDNTSLTDYDSCTAALCEIGEMGLLVWFSIGDDHTVKLDYDGHGKLFLDNYKHVSHLTSKEKWKERIWGFVLGILTTVFATLILSYFGI